jgi:coenzyme F420 biosynthesis associated uncharacterized protein
VSVSVDWELARRVAARVAQRDPYAGSYLQASLVPDFAELTPRAEELVGAATGLVPPTSARGRVADRAGWVDANLGSFQRLLRPLLDKLGSHHDPTGRLDSLLGGAPGRIAGAVGPRVAGAEVGLLLGWMSGRVLGQYDLLIAEDDRPEDQDIVYYVGPNILALEKRYGFPPREFRLWIALHECTHRAQFTAVSWLRPYFLSLVHELLHSIDPDPRRLVEALRSAVEQRRHNGSALRDGGVAALLASPEQRATMAKISGLMSLLEGHGDITMDRAAGADLIPSQARFSRVLSERRRSASGFNKVVQRLIGLEAKLAQYEQGEHFVRTVEATGGRSLFDRVWERAENLPTIDEIRQPSRWIDRMAVPTGA